LSAGTLLPVTRFAYPVALDLHDVTVLVVGAGRIAARKVDGLSAAGAIVHVVAPDVGPAIESAVLDGHVAKLRMRPFEPDDLDGVRLVITATGVPEVDAAVAAQATARGIWVNAADRPDECTFILPAIARNGPLTIAVTTDGSSPALAGRLRDRAADLLGDDVVELAGRLSEQRSSIKAEGGTTEDHDWRSIIDEALPPVR
jgi:precorrin-2 dehydrogenase/sirohydrochlorin ferrochelatase